MSSGEKDGNALSRWSRRKLEARAGRPADEDGETSRAATPAQKAPEVLSEEQTLEAFRESEPELADSISKIDIDKLTFEDDFTIFMKAAVPDFIRRKALAKLWTSNPILAVLDGLNDYDLDYTQGSDVAAKVQSAAKGARGRGQACGAPGKAGGRRRWRGDRRRARPAQGRWIQETILGAGAGAAGRQRRAARRRQQER